MLGIQIPKAFCRSTENLLWEELGNQLEECALIRVYKLNLVHSIVSYLLLGFSHREYYCKKYFIQSILLKKLYKSNLVIKYLPTMYRDQSLAHTGTHTITCLHSCIHTPHTHAHRLTRVHTQKKQAAHLHPSPTGVPWKSK